ncbi:hypothetical protein LQZ19_13855 [Treponema primitia]|uniref:hypothetical protein n=1 Tax=Treponema primitia TaxID=88058 RepID=UPI003980397C
MAKKGFLKTAFFLSLFVGLTVGVSAQVTFSAGFALSDMTTDFGGKTFDGETGVGVNIYFDYLLPVGIPLSLGFEIGFDAASATGDFEEYVSYGYGYGYGGYYETYSVELSGVVVPILLRAAYHFDLMPRLDLYLVGKLGYCVGTVDIDSVEQGAFSGIGYGFDVGAAFYLNSRFGFFIEAGFDQYNLERDDVEDYGAITVGLPFSRFLTFGISTKF